jgi:hypothetical protein
MVKKTISEELEIDNLFRKYAFDKFPEEEMFQIKVHFQRGI